MTTFPTQMVQFTSSDDDDNESESRTATVGLMRDARQKGQVHSVPVPSTDSSLSSQSPTMGNAASQTVAPAATNQDGPPNLASPTDNVAAGTTTTTTSSLPTGFGNNRLATGFRAAPHPAASDASQPSTSDRDGTLNASIPLGDSMDDAIEISDEQDESDGGMVINVEPTQYHRFSGDMMLDDHDVGDAEMGEEEGGDEDEEEEGETHSQADRDTESQASTRETTQPPSSTERDAHDQLQGDLERFSSTVTHPKAVDGRVQACPNLADLSPDELELQLKYAFFHVSRDKVDLNQPAVCLSCLQTGHAERNCPEVTCIHCSAGHSSRLCPLFQRCTNCRDRGHIADSCPTDLRVTTIPCDICGTSNHTEKSCPQRFLPYGLADSGPTRLWVSCCVCASKNHLVGDCPRANKAMAARWSLRSFAPGQITNLSLASGMQQREKEVANRGLRPEGLKIRGRAALHSAGSRSGTRQLDNSDSDERFLNPRAQRRGNAKRGNIKIATQSSREGSSPTAMPKKSVLMNFLRAINQPKPTSGKPQFELVYGDNG
ncbi:hypothetical protein AYO21_00191 [Fonsecaea monophora]|uniref:CCHC-type domain-containing protein n=1 Tax=Fonsecaea monophora TaxID=254056 RepID=A0A177FMQ6_9EURO|nr:hypothetical protein AYO21_00191 [Fonsecaea monophora]KAH0842183.1 hypothetical protein FOPE_07381 [Fonsecaea pedrosoi]OAG45555.1 hypothetical protein AYO21_00191 [Fonsecaea monophora]